MRVTIKELRRIIKEEYAKVLEEAEISAQPAERDTGDALGAISSLLNPEQRNHLASIFDHTMGTVKTIMGELKPVSGKKPNDLPGWPPVNSKQWESQMEQLITDARALYDNNASLSSALDTLSKRFEEFQNLIDPDRNEHAELQKQLKKFQAQNIPLDDKRVQALLAKLSQ